MSNAKMKLPEGCPAKSIWDCDYFEDGICVVEGDKFWIKDDGCRRAIVNKCNGVALTS